MYRRFKPRFCFKSRSLLPPSLSISLPSQSKRVPFSFRVKSGREVFWSTTGRRLPVVLWRDLEPLLSPSLSLLLNASLKKKLSLLPIYPAEKLALPGLSRFLPTIFWNTSFSSSASCDPKNGQKGFPIVTSPPFIFSPPHSGSRFSSFFFQ